MRKRGQKFEFYFSDILTAEVGGVTLPQLHFDGNAVLRAYERFETLAKRLEGEDEYGEDLSGF